MQEPLTIDVVSHNLYTKPSNFANLAKVRSLKIWEKGRRKAVDIEIDLYTHACYEPLRLLSSKKLPDEKPIPVQNEAKTRQAQKLKKV